MVKNKGKISVRQALTLFAILTITPTVRFAASSTALIAKQAAWLVPTVTAVFLFLMLYILNILLQGYKNKSFTEMIYDITSKFWGNLIIFLYLVWITILIAFYLRFYSERLVTSIYPNVKIDIFTISMLILIGFIIRNGIVVIARMGEISFILISIVILVLMIFMIPTIKINNLLPISYLDIMPTLKASFSGAALFYVIYLFFFAHEFTHQEEFFKYGKLTLLFIWLINTVIILASIGNLGHAIISRSPLSFLIAVKQVTLLGVVSGFESILVATWIISDFIMILVLTYSVLNIIKSLFKLSSYNSFINIFLVFLFFISWILANNVFELQTLSVDVVVSGNIIMQFILPIIIVVIALIRKKINIKTN
ncbi:GerAB/ArcD/ProY family transporter [Mycoplasmatota bacterium]|nr:GerAB/ArcD/ProY family transporter [Mycoplasmatota bacterium]